MRDGVVYFAIGEKFVIEAVQSVTSLRAVCNGIHATLFTNRMPEVFAARDVFDDIRVVPRGPRHGVKIGKIKSLQQSPYRRTLFLDTDTRICADISDVFGALNGYDIAVAHSPRRRSNTHWLDKEVPAWFPEMNSGVILYKKTPPTMKLLENWVALFMKYFRQYGCTMDQISLRMALHRTKIHVFVLPPEYNCRVVCPLFVGGRVHVVHGRGDIVAISRHINSKIGMRVHIPGIGLFNRREHGGPLRETLETTEAENTGVIRRHSGSDEDPVRRSTSGQASVRT